MSNIVIFPPDRHVSWRPIEAIALRRAGGAAGSLGPALDHLERHWLNLPSDMRAALVKAAREHIDIRVQQHRQAVGTLPLKSLDVPASVVPINERVSGA